MTELQEERVRWTEKYNELAEKINMPKCKWVSNNLETIKRKYTTLYLHYTRTKHLFKDIEWIVKADMKQCNVCDQHFEDEDIEESPDGFIICRQCLHFEDQELIDVEIDRQLSHGYNI